MKRKTFFFLTILLIIGTNSFSFGQKKKGDDTPPPAPKISVKDSLQKIYSRAYENALHYNDLGSAAQSLYLLMELEPERKGLRDTLASIYFTVGNYISCILVSDDILEKDPNNERAMELNAVSKQRMGLVKESLEMYEKLYASSRDPYHLYEIVNLQYGMKRLGECGASLQKLLSDPAIGDKKITISTNDNRMQEVPLTAAALNIAGVLEIEAGNKEQAIELYKKALEISPEFVLAKKNLELLTAK